MENNILVKKKGERKDTAKKGFYYNKEKQTSKQFPVFYKPKECHPTFWGLRARQHEPLVMLSWRDLGLTLEEVTLLDPSQTSGGWLELW